MHYLSGPSLISMVGKKTKSLRPGASGEIKTHRKAGETEGRDLQGLGRWPEVSALLCLLLNSVRSGGRYRIQMGSGAPLERMLAAKLANYRNKSRGGKKSSGLPAALGGWRCAQFPAYLVQVANTWPERRRIGLECGDPRKKGGL